MKRTLLVTGFAVLCSILLSGCQSGSNSAFGFGGLPKEQYRIGGGFEIEYDAPADGTFYLVDQTSGKFVVTEDVTDGDTFDFSIEPGDLDQAKAFGINLEKSKLVLYFVPKPEQQ